MRGLRGKVGIIAGGGWFVAIFLQGFDIFNGAVGLDSNAHLLDIIDFPVDYLLGQAMLRNADCHHAAGNGQSLEYGNRIAFLGQEVSSAETGRSGANHGYFLFLGYRDILRKGLFLQVVRQAVLHYIVGNEALGIINADGFFLVLLELASVAFSLARMGANPADDAREG